MPAARASTAPSAPPAAAEIERRIADRLGRLRTERGWSLEALAERSGISRATLSRLERGELSPTASMLGRLCTTFGWTLSRLMAEAETRAPNLVPATQQAVWTDPETGYRRRLVSPPAPGLRGELVEIRLPARATVGYEASPVPGRHSRAPTRRMCVSSRQTKIAARSALGMIPWAASISAWASDPSMSAFQRRLSKNTLAV